ncbi:hypothetical protein [Nocardiopsis chromatogenes]|uniref:hypothetical protein n=1 Tax=Nocardiopsis chromatogenes TaxID=280239 RepID=UPI000382E885|nr:hypothetical protein [Nocardiopsis chromatogenes]
MSASAYAPLTFSERTGSTSWADWVKTMNSAVSAAPTDTRAEPVMAVHITPREGPRLRGGCGGA